MKRTPKKSPKKPVRPKAKTTTVLNVILDRSGSMAGMTEATISGFNEFIKEQRRVNTDDARVTLTLFDTELETVYIDLPLDQVPALTDKVYWTRGMTALYDAIGITARAAQTRLQDSERMLVLVMTDGLENASREFSRDKIKTLVKGMEAKGNVTFTFIGGNLDTVGGAGVYGATMGVGLGNTLNNSVVTPHSHSHSIQAMSSATAAFRSSAAKQTASFYSSTVGSDVSKWTKDTEKKKKST